MRIFAINIRQGGGERISALLQRLPDAEAIVLSEYRDARKGQFIREALSARGYGGFAFAPYEAQNGVLIATKGGGYVVAATRRVCEVAWGSLRICGIYMPQGEAKRPVFEQVLRSFAGQCYSVIIIGDFNTGRNDLDISRKGAAKFYCSDQFAELEKRMVEAWRYLHPRDREYSWYSRGHKSGIETGWRIDHAFLSPDLIPRLKSCTYDHGFRTEGLTDHSGLLLEIA